MGNLATVISRSMQLGCVRYDVSRDDIQPFVVTADRDGNVMDMDIDPTGQTLDDLRESGFTVRPVTGHVLTIGMPHY